MLSISVSDVRKSADPVGSTTPRRQAQVYECWSHITRQQEVGEGVGRGRRGEGGGWGNGVAHSTNTASMT